MDELEALVDTQMGSPVSYREVGGTRGQLPHGYRHDRSTREAGSGSDAFVAARAAVRDWAGHRHAGAALHPPKPEIVEGATLALALRAAGLWITATCRVVWVVDEPTVFGFGYGTLPHHPEVGEESFLCRIDDSGRVQFEITAFSRPQSKLAQLGGPIGRWLQQRTTRRYLDGLADYAIE